MSSAKHRRKFATLRMRSIQAHNSDRHEARLCFNESELSANQGEAAGHAGFRRHSFAATSELQQNQKRCVLSSKDQGRRSQTVTSTLRYGLKILHLWSCFSRPLWRTGPCSRSAGEMR